MLGDLRYEPAATHLVPLLADTAPRVRFFAAEALGRIAYKPAAPQIVAMLAANDDKDVYLRHAGSLALSRIGDTSALGALSTHPSRGVRIAAIVALRRLRSPEVARFVTDSDDAIVLEAARAINDDGSIEGALPALAGLLAEKRFASEPLLRRVINANLKVGSADALARLATFAGDATGPQAMRVEAVAAMGVWPDPSPMDRVDGIYLGQPKPRDAAGAQAAVLRLMEASSMESAPVMKVALAEAAGRLGVQGAAAILASQLKGDASPQVRTAALRALQALKVSNIDELMKIAVADADANVRRAALGILPSLPLSDAAKAQNLSAVIRGGTVNDQQAGFEVLGTLKSPRSRAGDEHVLRRARRGEDSAGGAARSRRRDAGQRLEGPGDQARRVSQDEVGGHPDSRVSRCAVAGRQFQPWPSDICREPGRAMYAVPHRAQCRIGCRAQSDRRRDAVDA